MPSDLSRLLKPRSVCVIGGKEAARVVEQCVRMNYAGAIYPVHPRRGQIAGRPCFRSVAALPEAPDASFVGVRRERAIEMVRALAARGAGGAVCYASGFSETDATGAGLQADLVVAAGAMPVLGPNCYGFINYLDGVPLWPDQHGGARVERGVAILSQSSNIAITLTMNRRALPLALIATLGNRACLGAAAVAEALLDDPRISALGLALETLEEAPALAELAARARARRIPVVVHKLGQSEEGARITLTHTASLAGEQQSAAVLLKRLGLAQARSVPAFLETLKLLHTTGPLSGRAIASMSCSGGEAALMADALAGRRLQARALTTRQRQRVAATLNNLVTVSNPLDYHTFIWGDEQRLKATFGAMLSCRFDLGLLVIDPPRTDRCRDRDWRIAIHAYRDALADTGTRGALLAVLPESLDETLAQELISQGIAPLAGVDEGLDAVEAAADLGAAWASGPPQLEGLQPLASGAETLLSEWESKQRLAGAGVEIPAGALAGSLGDVQRVFKRIGRPVAIKAVSRELAHKSERGAVRLNIGSQAQATRTARALLPISGQLLVERMVEDGVAEVIIGVNRDPHVGLTLLIGSGGELAELAGDQALLLPPVSRLEIEGALRTLKVGALLAGFRARPPGDLAALVDQALAIQQFALDNAATLLELDVNPIIVRAAGRGAVAVDAFMRIIEEKPDG